MGLEMTKKQKAYDKEGNHQIHRPAYRIDSIGSIDSTWRHIVCRRLTSKPEVSQAIAACDIFFVL